MHLVVFVRLLAFSGLCVRALTDKQTDATIHEYHYMHYLPALR